jgi:DNA-binding SARP family transcriptional activator
VVSDLTVRLLGALEATVDGRPVDLGGPRQRAVFALLLVAGGDVVSVDRLIDDLWRGEPPPRATGALQAYVSNLRRALEPERAPRMPSSYLISAPPGYALRLDDAPGAAVDARQV